MKSEDIEKAKRFVIVEILEYIPHAVLSTTILNKTTGTVSVVSFDSGEGLTERSSPFDTFIQVIDGIAEIVIDGVSTMLNVGQGIVIPAHARNAIKSAGQFKVISTIIKSGYETLPI